MNTAFKNTLPNLLSLGAIASLFFMGPACTQDAHPHLGDGDNGGAGGGGRNGLAGDGGNAGNGVHGGMGGVGNNSGLAGQGGMGGNGGQDAGNGICPTGMNHGNPLPSAVVVATPLKNNVFHAVEGPVWIDNENAFFFSDMQGQPWNRDASSKIWKYTPADGAFTEFMTASGSNGLAIWTDGRILAATHANGGLTLFDPGDNSKKEVLIAGLEGKPFNAPNDLTVRSDGVVYFSDPNWQKPQNREDRGMKVYWVDKDKRVEAFDELTQPNGITLSTDEKTLYVSDYLGQVRNYTIATDGKPDAGETFVMTEGTSPDGMAIDCAGNLYVTSSRGVEVFDSNGQPIGTITVGGAATNAAFGGPDRKTLFITRSKEVYAIDLNVPGMPY